MAARRPAPCLAFSLSLSLSLAVPLALPVPARAQGQDFSKVEIQAQALAPGLYVLTGAGGNIGLAVGDDAVFVIDDQFAPLAPKIKAAIARLTPKPVQFVLNTHFHFDHTGGNEAFGKDGALIVAHDNARKRMTSDQLISLVSNTARQAASPKAALPVVTVAGEITFHINGEEVHAFHVPRAHTDGDLVVHFRKGDVVHMGDVYFNGFYPFIDVGSGGSPEGVIAAVDRVLALAGDRTKIIPGHGPLASKADLAEYRQVLATAVQRVKEARRAGKSDDEIRAAKPLADLDERYGKGFMKPEAFLHLLLAGVPR
ncbi:MAG: MBL fold metallo-hydrolase [Burkholderiales bacterium]|nr:MBL fold metallo-hydrolase [Burkholderiales bacterium]